MAPPTKKDNGASSPSPTLTDAEAVKLRKADNTMPAISQIKVSLRYSGDLLAKDDSKWTPWSKYMKLELTMMGLYEYIFDPPDVSNKLYEPCAHWNWQLNNRLARLYLLMGLSQSERNLADDTIAARSLWDYLQNRHGGAGLVQQVRLLQEALMTKCSPSEPLTKTIDRIFEKINCAFDVGDVTKELLQSIATLSFLSDNSLYANTRSIISRNLAAATASTPYGPDDIRRFLQNEQTLYAADKGMADTQLTALAAWTQSKRDDLVCDNCKSCGQPVFTGHTKPWCILEGGGMAGKTLEDARVARLAHYKAKRENHDKKKGPTKLTVTPAGGSAFTVEGDPDALAAYIASRTSKSADVAVKTEFAGLAADNVPDALVDVESLEIDTWIALEEEPQVSIDWTECTTESTLSSAAAPFDTYPFYLDSGATVHISPNAPDFNTLTPILHKPIRGVGGSTISATAIGKIRLRLANGSYLVLDNALYVPKATVKLLSISYDPKAKAYRCYDRVSRRVYSTYHVKFIKHQDEYNTVDQHTSPPTPDDTSAPSIETISRRAVDHPFVAPDDDEEPVPSESEKVDTVQPIPEVPADPIPLEQDERLHQRVEPIQQQPQWSTRAPIPSVRSQPDAVPETAIQRTTRESRESADQIREAKAERRRAIEELHREDRIEPPNDVNENIDLDQVLTTISSIEDKPGINANDVDPEVPKTWSQAQNSPDVEQWRTAYDEELKSLKDMGVYCLIPREEVPAGHKIHCGHPVFTLKRNEKGEVVQFKVRHVLQGFNQVDGKEYMKTTSPTVHAESWQILLHLAAVQGWDAMQVDIKIAFLYGVLPEEETTYMEQPRGFEESGKESYVLSSKQANEYFKSQLQETWTILDLGTPRQIVGIAIEWDRPNRTVYLSQTPIIDRLISQFRQKDANPLSLPMEPGLKLRQTDYSSLTQRERDDIAKIPYRRLQLSQYFDSYSLTHWNAAIRVVRYLKGTRNLWLRLGGTSPVSLAGFTDSDWANCLNTRRSVGGYAWSLGSGAISWASRKQKTVAASSCEAEYMAAFEAAQECIWLRTLLWAVGHNSDTATTIMCDNNAAVNLSEDPLLHSRVKHVDIKYHFLREWVASNELIVKYINTKDNVADLFTKPLPLPRFSCLRSILGLS
ncbi:Copia protein [Termitomyces sp. T112]|nr:Copia protein [Termitomyces sp. T112]